MNKRKATEIEETDVEESKSTEVTKICKLDRELFSQWHCLPEIILEQIFKNLEENDRFNALLVCDRWSKIIRSTASLWRKKKFRFSGRNPTDLTHVPYKAATQYIKTFGKFLHELDMQLYSPISSQVCRKFYSCLRVNLNVLIKNKCRLRKISLPCLYLERSQCSRSCEPMVNMLAKFFCKCQPSLTKVNLQCGRISFQHAYKILFSLALNQGRHIHELDIEDFISDRSPVYEFKPFVDCMSYFTNLTELCLNYSYLSDDVINVMAEKLRQDSLQKIYIRVSWHDPEVHGIYGRSWAKLASKCSNMKAYFYFLRVLSFDAHLKVLRPEIPVRQINFDGSYFYDNDWHICPTLNSLLPQYEQSLRRLTLDLPDTLERFEGDLLRVCEKCPDLYLLDITAFISTKFIERLLEMVQDGRCGIDTLRVKVLVSDFDTSAREIDLERIYRTHRNTIKEKFYKYEIWCATSI